MDDTRPSTESDNPSTESAAARRLATYLSHIPVALIETRVGVGIVAWSTAAERLFGYTREEVLGKSLIDLVVAEEDRDAIRRVMQQIALGEAPDGHAGAFLNRRKGGERVHCEWYNSRLTDASGAMVGLLTAATDGTEAARERERGNENFARFELLMRGAKNGLWDYKPLDPMRPVDPDYPVYVSDGLLYMTGRTRANMPKRLGEWSTLLHPDDAGWVEQSFLQHIRERREYSYLEYRLSHTDGAAVWTGTTWQALWDGRGGLLRFAGALMDITERKQVEEELREKLAVIERQASAIRELSTPILEVHEGVLCLPIVGVVDSRRASEMMDAALGAAVQRGARFLLLDLTGVSALDASTAERLLSIARAVRLLGAEVVITGLGALTAQTVVNLGVSLDEITTLRSLKEGLRYCLRASTR